MWRASAGARFTGIRCPASPPPSPSCSPPRRVAAVAAFALGLGGDDDRPGQEAIDRYLAAWARGDDAAAAAATDRPDAARRVLAMNRDGLDGASVAARVLERRDADGESAARVRVRWDVPRFGAFAYEVRVDGAAGASRVARALGRRGRAPGAAGRHAARARACVAAARRDPRPGRPRRWSPSGRWWTSRCRSTRSTIPPPRRRRSPRRSTSTATSSPRRIRAAGDGRFVPVITLRARGLRRGGGAGHGDRGRLAQPHDGAARAVQRLRPGAARHGRPGHGGAARARPRAARGRRRDRAVRARAGPRRAPRRRAGAQRRAAPARVGDRGAAARAPRRPARAAAAHAAGPRRADGGRDRARHARARRRSSPCSRPPATCWPSRTGPRTARTTARCSAATRPARRSRSSAPPRCSRPASTRRRPSTARRRWRSTASRSATSRAAPPARSRSPSTSRRAATRRSSRSPGGSTGTR